MSPTEQSVFTARIRSTQPLRVKLQDVCSYSEPDKTAIVSQTKEDRRLIPFPITANQSNLQYKFRQQGVRKLLGIGCVIKLKLFENQYVETAVPFLQKILEFAMGLILKDLRIRC